MLPTLNQETLLTPTLLQALHDCRRCVIPSIAIFLPAHLSTHAITFITLEVPDQFPSPEFGIHMRCVQGVASGVSNNMTH